MSEKRVHQKVQIKPWKLGPPKLGQEKSISSDSSLILSINLLKQLLI